MTCWNVDQSKKQNKGRNCGFAFTFSTTNTSDDTRLQNIYFSKLRIISNWEVTLITFQSTFKAVGNRTE